MSQPHLDEHAHSPFSLDVWKRMLPHALVYRAHLIWMGVAGIFLALLDTLFPWMTGKMIDEVTKVGLSQSLRQYGIGYAVMVVMFALSVWFFIWLAGKIITGIAFDLRDKGFRKYQELSFSYYDKHSIGWLLSRLTSDCNKLSSLVPWLTLDVVWGTTLLTFLVIAMMAQSWQLALVVLSIVPPLILVSIYFQRKLLESARHVRKNNAKIIASFNESLMGIRTTKTLNRESENLKEFQGLSGEMYDHSTRNALQNAVYLPIITSLGSIGIGLALWMGGYTVGLQKSAGISLGTLIAFMQYATLLYHPIEEIARRFSDLQNAQAAAERIQELLDTEPAIQDSVLVRQAIASYTPQKGIAHDGYPDKIRHIVFDHVDFSYNQKETVLKDFQLEVHTGQTIALVGSTGSGKSTIVNLVARFYEVTQGAILFDGIDIRERSLHWLHSKLGVVLQSPHLFSGTIRENIRYGRLDATDEEIEQAAKMVNAHDFISRLPKTYETQVGEQGSQLSTGQKQLLSLARALLSDPEIFIMDEATSSVDTETERLIQDGLERVLSGRIAFVIAHRLSTIRSADRILVIDKGVIVEDGDHDTLIKKKGRYYDLYTKQFVQEQQSFMG
ncbi:MAG TPA: ABC transporter ATP-binding protein [Myxococcales bacterium]|nr:ABC transporter ATP-binding protein [Deltaproteobacteria bacterium]MBU54783.1 ABC transporter ATP-binding protein [Deltaproteobacteria bacterium]HAA57775.1 ABC transporter ATP-binding protein [Myxococcales bacterium]